MAPSGNRGAVFVTCTCAADALECQGAEVGQRAREVLDYLRELPTEWISAKAIADGMVLRRRAVDAALTALHLARAVECRVQWGHGFDESRWRPAAADNRAAMS